MGQSEVDDGPLTRLINGFEKFRADHFDTDDQLMADLAQFGQRPAVLVIACSDSRVDPAIMTRARPGELFIIRNVAAIVPPYAPASKVQGTSSAIEFAVRALRVDHVVVLGHAKCGGMKLLHERGTAGHEDRFEFVDAWVERAAAARTAVQRTKLPPEQEERLLEEAGVVLSLQNLLTFPWVKERVAHNDLALHGWYFDLTIGELLAFDDKDARFVPAKGAAHPLSGARVLDNGWIAPERFVQHAVS
ncbi:carbonic anhydrase [Arboricoccus pini]|uniref:Carbonic anhydrase n=1 Tax=Arboricoccus pini TaxID=1963835 RepID=A0A212R8B5_9PROT|nr:carbonic anhydrase [Arboricoccus pini]SNB68369.1 carbonic anhydrase [Arboricoccus pini]